MGQFPESLPHSEWDFSTIDHADSNIACLYEYARESKSIKGQVEQIREMGGYRSLALRAQERGEVFSHVYPNLAGIIKTPFGNAIFALSDLLNSYPEKSFSDVIGTSEAKFFRESLQELISKDVLIADMFDVQDAIDFKPKHLLKEKAGKSVAEAIVDSFGVNANIVVSIPPNSTHKEILTAIEAEISEEKIAQYLNKKTKGKNAGSRGFNGVKMPFSTESALEWLSIWRKYRHHNFTWSNVIDEYGSKGDEHNAKRSLLAKSTRAKEILNWFDAFGAGGFRQIKSTKTFEYTPDA